MTRLMMMPSSQAATSADPKRGRSATATPATISTTPTMYIIVWAGSGTTWVTTGARYIVQSVKRFVNLSRPNRIGATVKTVRSNRKAWWSAVSFWAGVARAGETFMALLLLKIDISILERPVMIKQ